MKWYTKQINSLKINNAIVLEGLPGIGNVGKISVDFIIDKINAKKIYEIKSDKFPHCVFVNEENTIDLPKIEIYYKKVKSNELIFVSGDVQPIDEHSCYEFCNNLLDLLKHKKLKEIITLGGVGINEIPKDPKLYCTGTDQKIINKYKDAQMKDELYGTIGPIMGVSGLLLGLAKERKVPGVAILAETFGHPAYIGINGAREILKHLNKKLKLNLDLKELDKEIKELESELKLRNETLDLAKRKKVFKKEYTNYIG